MRGVFFAKSGKLKLFFGKKWTFPRRRVHYVQYQYFFNFTFYLYGGCVRTQRNPPPAVYGPVTLSAERRLVRSVSTPAVSRNDTRPDYSSEECSL